MGIPGGRSELNYGESSNGNDLSALHGALYVSIACATSGSVADDLRSMIYNFCTQSKMQRGDQAPSGKGLSNRKHVSAEN